MLISALQMNDVHLAAALIRPPHINASLCDVAHLNEQDFSDELESTESDLTPGPPRESMLSMIYFLPITLQRTPPRVRHPLLVA